MKEWLSREEVLAMLGVRPQTLYAYVSRGTIERRADPLDPRRSLYRAVDVAGLSGRRTRGRRTASIAAGALAWGEPVIPTAIATVDHGQLVLRGHRAVDLAETMTLEEVAALLWEIDGPVGFPVAAASADPFQAIAARVADARSMIGRPVAKLAVEAAACVATIGAAFGAQGDGAMHARLARGWSLGPGAADRVRRALVLLADHELNPSTFATRIAASTGAAMPACILAGLATLSGPKHGGAGGALAALLAEIAATGLDAALERWLALGHPVPGFGHPLYLHGDPRAGALLATVTPDDDMIRLRDAVADTLDLLPNIDFALQALARAEGMPAQACLALFATARAVGWAAHAMEQVAAGGIIRPRAVYHGARRD